ncbi:MAG: nucleotide sugar dehydrogenase [Pseudomonadota bacterium]
MQRERGIAVVGLGYVGLPLAVRLSQHHDTVFGFDISDDRVTELVDGHDATGEVDDDVLVACPCQFTTDVTAIKDASFYIVTVPTPILDTKQPDLEPLHRACETLGPLLQRGDIVVFESTVYPGVTEDVCGPILARMSGLTQGVDFNLGYSPERINPGDRVNRLETIIKNVSADTDTALQRVVDVYEPVIDAGLFRCSSIKVAEAAKVIENTQRDVNIALMNELSMICSRIGVDTLEVIDAAATKWNFLPFKPGLVGGHCIGVDPYYLASLSERVGHHPEVILSGRRLNDAMPRHTVGNIVKLLVQRGKGTCSARVGVFGISFKENVPDLRNSKSLELIDYLKDFGCAPFVHDPMCDPVDARRYGVELAEYDAITDLDLMVLAVPHAAYHEDAAILSKLKPDGIIADIRGAFRKSKIPEDIHYWSM